MALLPVSYAQELKTADISPEIVANLPDNLSLKINNSSYDLSKTEIESWFREAYHLEYNPHYQSEIENQNICPYKNDPLCYLIFPYNRRNHIQKKSTLKFQKKNLEEFVNDLARRADKDPEDAKLKAENGKVTAFSLSEKGLRLDQEKSQEEILNYIAQKNFQSPLSLPFQEVEPSIAIDSIDNLGITSLIGEGVSNFRGSPKNRIYNITVATKRFDGVLIKPGEEFSFVNILGEVDGEHGYLPELVIKKDKTEPEFGGGICQVSTTVFRAAIYAGLKITARRNHAYPVSYYNPQGMDATVYVPRPDLRFINNTPNYILIQPKIEGTQLTIDFYGTSDGRKVEVDGPKVTSREADGSMKTTFTQRVYDKDGNLLREDKFNSSYDSPSKYPHPATTSDQLKSKPDGWSAKQWKAYKKSMGM